jgi:beta-galactosidase
VERAGVDPVVAGLPPRVEAAARGDVITLINHNPHPVTLDTGQTLKPYAYQFHRP